MGTGAKCSLYAWIQRPQLPPPTVSSPTYCSQEVQVSYRGKEPWMAPRPLPLSFQVRTQREVIVQITGRARTPKGRGCGWEPGPLCPQHLHLGTNGRGHSTPSQRTPRNSPFVLCGLLGLGKDLTHSQKGRPLVGRLSLRPGLRPAMGRSEPGGLTGAFHDSPVDGGAGEASTADHALEVASLGGLQWLTEQASGSCSKLLPEEREQAHSPSLSMQCLQLWPRAPPHCISVPHGVPSLWGWAGCTRK